MRVYRPRKRSYWLISSGSSLIKFLLLTALSLMLSYAQAFTALWLYRYVRLIVNWVSYLTFKPIPLPEKPTLMSSDVTIIIPTICRGGSEFQQTLLRCLRTRPFEIIVVTIDANLDRVAGVAASLGPTQIRVMSIPRANKRRQVCAALPQVQTKITVLADDDVLWPPKILDWILAALEKPDIGGVGTCQRLRREARPNLWNFLAALYLERRNFEIAATTNLDGGISCLSGRTAAYRTKILQDPNFAHGFTHEHWLGKYLLSADDDNFITRWMVSHGWKTYVQYCPEAELRTTLEDNPKFLKQCLRWARSNWRSNLRSMFYERHVWRQQPWCAYALYLATLSPPAIIGDGLLVFLLQKTTQAWDTQSRQTALAALLTWMLISKIIKLFGHFTRYPADILFLPVSILFGYFHGLIKVYASLTLYVTAWGTRQDADAAEEKLQSSSLSGVILLFLHTYIG